MRKWMISIGVATAVLLTGVGFAAAHSSDRSQPRQPVPAVTSVSVQPQVTPTTQPQVAPTTQVTPPRPQPQPQPQAPAATQPAVGNQGHQHPGGTWDDGHHWDSGSHDDGHRQGDHHGDGWCC
jgi:outer membrane biosynthesis protein TonB